MMVRNCHCCIDMSICLTLAAEAAIQSQIYSRGNWLGWIQKYLFTVPFVCHTIVIQSCQLVSSSAQTLLTGFAGSGRGPRQI